MSISRGSGSGGNASGTSVNIGLGLTAGQVAIVSVISGNSGAHSWPGGWTVWFNQAINAGGAQASVATKVLTSGDISSGVTVSGLGSSIDYTTGIYAGNSPTIDTGSAAFAYAIPASASATVGDVTVTPTYTNEWLIGVVFGSTIASPSVTGSVALNEYQSQDFYTGFSLAHFDSDGTVSQAALTETFAATNTGSHTFAGVLLCVSDVSAPSAPTLLAPSSGSYVDLTANVAFSATYNSTDTQNQNAYAFRIKVSGGSYQYWNAGTSALQGSIVWNATSTAAGANFTLTLPGGTESNGYTYDWNFASQEAGANLQGPFAGSDFVLIGQTAPTLTVNSPTGTISTSSPTVGWTTTPAAGTFQTAYRLVVYTSAQQGIGGFTPGVSPSTYDSGTVVSNSQNAVVGTTLQNLITYYAYVQVTQTGGELSAWEYTSFTTQLDMPNAPGLSVSGGFDANGVPCMIIDVQGYDNLLSGADSAITSSATWTWVAGSNTAISLSTVQVAPGSAASLVLAPGTAGSISATTVTTAYKVVPSATYTAIFSARANASAQLCTVGVKWYNSGGSLISTTTSGGVSDSTSAWTAISNNVTAPATSDHAEIVVTIGSSGTSADYHYVGDVGLMPGSNTPWDLGGFAGAAQLILERSDGLFVRGAGYSTDYPNGPVVGSNTASIPGGAQMLTVYDYEGIPFTEYDYTGTVTFSAGYGTVSSSATISNTAEFSVSNWWFIEPLTPSASLQLSVVSHNVTQYEAIAVHYPVVTPGVPVPPTVISGGIFNPDGDLVTQTQTAAQYAALQAEINNGTVKWLISALPTGEFVRYSAANPIGGSAGSAQQTTVTPGFASTPYRNTTVGYVSASRP